MKYNEINFSKGRIVLSNGIENFKEVLEKRGPHLYITTYSFDMPDDFYNQLLENIEFLNDIRVIFNIYDFKSIENEKVDNLIKRALKKNPYIQFYYCDNNHSKIISNGNMMYIGSANLTGYTKRNLEAGVLIEDKSVIEEVERKIFGFDYLQYEPVYTDPIAILITPFQYIKNITSGEFEYIESLLEGVDRSQIISEEDLPSNGIEIKENLESYLSMFMIAKKDLISFAESKSEEYFIVTNLLDEIENYLIEILADEPIGSETNRFFNFFEEYRLSNEQYKEHFFRMCTFENELVLYKEKIYLSKVKTILKILQNLRFKWISILKSDEYVRHIYKLHFLDWLKSPETAKQYWDNFL